jgi:gliding motility-associated-like protein
MRSVPYPGAIVPAARRHVQRPWVLVRLVLWLSLALWATLGAAQQPAIEARFEPNCDDLRLFLSTPIQAERYTWSLSDGRTSDLPAPVLRVPYAEALTVTLTTEDASGVTATYLAEFPLRTQVRIDEADIPNVFTPNGDGVNDRFALRGQPQLGACSELSIFDRYGNRVFVGQGNNMTWDGRTMAGEACLQAQYFYVLTISGREFSGHLSLLR